VHNDDPFLYDEEPPPEDADGTEVPQNRRAEMAVLGSVLADPSALAEVSDLLQPSDFYRPAHETIYHVILEAFARLEPSDPISIGDRLESRGDLSRVGGHTYLHELVASVPTSANASYYAEIVARLAMRRRLIEAGTRIARIGAGEGQLSEEDMVTKAGACLDQARRVIPGLEPIRHEWEPVVLQEILDNGDVVVQPTILERTDGICLLYEGAFHSISGEPETGKTWVALLACAQVLRAGGEVTYVDFEDRPGRVVTRLIALGVHRSAIGDRFHYIRPMRPIDPMGRAHLDVKVSASKICVLDGVTEAMTLHGLSIDKQDEVARFIHMFPKRLADLGPAVVQIDHLPKNTEAGNRFAIGAQHKLAGLDGAAYMVKIIEPFARGKIGRAKISVAKDREGSVREHASGHTIAELVLDSDQTGLRAYLEPPLAQSRGSSGEWTPTMYMERVSRYLEGVDGAQTGKQIEANVSGKAAVIRDAVKALVLESYLDQEPGPHGSVLYTLSTPYRDPRGGD